MKLLILLIFNLYVDVSLQSSGCIGGYLALRIYYLQPRFQDGTSPVCIYVPGTNKKGDLLPPPSGLIEEGIVFIKFLFPGGYDTLTGRHSDGIYDNRGMNCLKALKDIVLFSQGIKTDSLGRTIDEIVGYPIDHDNVGFFASSNGGGISTIVTSIFKDSIIYPVWMVGWENPTNSQLICADLVNKDRDSLRDGDNDGNPLNDYWNPRYIRYGDTILVVDYSQIKFDPNFPPTGCIFLDGNGNDTFDLIDLGGFLSPDLDSSGLLEIDEDFLLIAFPDTGGKWVYSYPVTLAAAQYNIFGGSWPPWIADTQEARIFWSIREAVLHYDNALKMKAVILVFSKWDHVQPHDDKPHIHQAFNGFFRNGIWVRLNPDSVYSSYVFPFASFYPDNPANWAPSDWNTIENYAYPEDEDADRGFQIAGILEMVDRVYYDIWIPDLDEMLVINERTDNFQTKKKIRVFNFQIDKFNVKNLKFFDICGRRLNRIQKGVFFAKVNGKFRKFVFILFK